MNYQLLPEIETTTAPETLTAGDNTDIDVPFVRTGAITSCSYLTRRAHMFSYPKPVPVIVELVPPLIGPRDGKTERIVGC